MGIHLEERVDKLNQYGGLGQRSDLYQLDRGIDFARGICS